jgi:iron complex outermembrane receptor protein
MVSKTGQSNPGHQLRLELGSDDTFRGNLQSGHNFERGDLFFSLSGSVSDGFRDHADQENIKFNTNFAVNITDRIETRFYFTLNDIELELPGSVNLQSALETPRASRPTVFTSDQHRDIESYRLSNKTTIDLGGGNLLAMGAYWTDKDLFHPITPFVGVIDQQSTNYGAFVQGSGTFKIAGHLNRFRLGVTNQNGMTDARVFTNIGGQSGALLADADQSAINIVAYGENHFYITPELAVVTGLQYVWSNRDVDDHVMPTESDSDSYDSVNPRLGILYQPLETVQFFGNFTKSFEPPDFSNLTQSGTSGFVKLDAQKAWTIEIGSRGQYGLVSWDITLYRAWLEDELLKFTPGADIPATTFNAKDTVHQGLEVGLDFQLARNLICDGDSLKWLNAYTYSHFFFDNDAQFGDNYIPGQPPHHYQSELRYDHGDDWFVAVNMDVASRADVDFMNTFTAPGYTTFGFKTGYEVNKSISLFVTGRNLTDEGFVSNFSTAIAATSATALFYGGDGRRFFGGATIKF